ncbi:hypothetical protein [Nocardioides sp. 616]|uniref:hypothetical protein n=1 Tax=Nocardioides sp. 616 TaxID=2268090 RepID=UPI000CE3257A|nr:hypothetical protein [Nocardioides sp. 616]
MLNSSGNLDAPPALRATTPGWRDPRLWIGVALVAVSVVVGARVVGGADESVAMWSVSRELAPGDVLEPSDLEVTRVRFAQPADARAYFGVDDELPADRYLLRGIGVGEMVPRAVLGAPRSDIAHVSVSVPSAQVPPSVRSGSVVDVWLAPRPGAETARARLAVSEVTVVEAPRASSGFGAEGQRQLVLGVADEGVDLARVLTASGTDRLMLVGRG